MRWRGLLIVVGPALVMAAGCSGDEEAPPDLASYFAAEPYQNNLRCSTVDGQLTGRREMRLFRSGPADVKGCTQGLQRYFLRHSLQFFTTEAEAVIDLPYAMDNRGPALEQALLARFPGVNLRDEAALMKDPALWNEIQRFVANFTLRPLIEFARAHSQLGQQATNMVLLPGLFAVRTPSSEGFLGLATSLPLLAAHQVEDPSSFSWKDSDLPPDFTPMLFLDARAMRDLLNVGRQVRDVAVAHEFGHTAGLVHEVGTDDEDNLMYPSVNAARSDCEDNLRPEQLALMRQSLSVGPPTVLTRVAQPRPTFTPADLRALLASDPTPLRALLSLSRRR